MKSYNDRENSRSLSLSLSLSLPFSPRYWDATDDMTRVSLQHNWPSGRGGETAREQREKRERRINATGYDRHNGLIVADMFSEWGPLPRRARFSVVREYREWHRYRVPREEDRRTMRTRVFVVSLFAANLPRALTCSDSFSIPLFTFFSLSFSLPLSFSFFPYPLSAWSFFPKNALPTVISVINGHPLTTRFILDHRFVSREKDRFRGQM